MTRAMLFIHSMVAMFVPAHRPVLQIIEHPPSAAGEIKRLRDVEELEHAARQLSATSTCRLVAIAQRVVSGRRPEELNGRGEHEPGVG
jgi:hypothetical protein